jgi:hypothetical protein
MRSSSEEDKSHEDKAAADSRAFHLWDLLNSNFGLWLLSAVFITAGGTALNRMVAEHETRQKEPDPATSKRIWQRETFV